MAISAACTDQSTLKRLIDEQLDQNEQLAVEAHLGECDSCCNKLHELAAGDDWWEDASTMLGTAEATDAEVIAGRVPTGNRPAEPKPMPAIGLAHLKLSRTDVTASDVPLDFLEPCDNEAMLGQLGGYEITEPIGCGGMGVVLKGHDRELNRFVAVKVLAPHYASSPAARQRFGREARAAAAVVHPNVLAIHSVDATGYLPYLVMPFVDGESLHDRIARIGSLDIHETLRIAIQAARGLHAAHEQGIVHRDVKPGNILIDSDADRAMLTDFGLARAIDDASMTRSGVIAGTPQFMSPEQASGDVVDHRSDLFSLGSVLYTMCVGRPPFKAETTMGLLRRIVDDEARPLRELNPSVPVWMQTIINRLHAKLPADRFQSALELAELLEGCLAHIQHPSVTALPASIRVIVERPRRVRSWLTVGAASCLALFASWQAYRAAVFDDATSARSSNGSSQAEKSSASWAPSEESAAGQDARAGDASPEMLSGVPDWQDNTSTLLFQIDHEVERLEFDLNRESTSESAQTPTADTAVKNKTEQNPKFE